MHLIQGCKRTLPQKTVSKTRLKYSKKGYEPKRRVHSLFCFALSYLLKVCHAGCTVVLQGLVGRFCDVCSKTIVAKIAAFAHGDEIVIGDDDMVKEHDLQCAQGFAEAEGYFDVLL